MSLEGELCLRLRICAGRIEKVGIESSRPPVARKLLQGRNRDELAAVMPGLFSICGRSHAAASALAFAAAAGEATGGPMLEACTAAVGAEMLRENLWRVLLDWPRWLGQVPDDGTVALARRALEAPVLAAALGEEIALEVFGMPAADWLQLSTVDPLQDWMAPGKRTAARLLTRVRDEERAAWPHRAGAASLLESEDHARWIAALAPRVLDEPGYAPAPTRDGRPAETGALARQQAEPLIVEAMRHSPARQWARHVARLRELATGLAGTYRPCVGALALPGQAGIAWVENARGLLIHAARLDGTRALQYAIVAPTEWNFHPQGALALALVGTPAESRDEVVARTQALVRSLDPCVAFRIEVEDA